MTSHPSRPDASDAGTGPESQKFDPARAHLLDSAERDAFLPDRALVELLEVTGDETVLDYGAGTGRVALAAAAQLPRGRVIAVDENPEMLQRLRARTAQTPQVEVLPVRENRVELPDGIVDRILAINLLHEVRGETALAEMRRLLRPRGRLLVADWNREAPGEPGPPSPLRYSLAEAVDALTAADFDTERPPVDLPYHFVLVATPATP